MSGVSAGIRGILFDLDGTIYVGERLIDGAGETLAWCRDRRIPYRFVTNTTSKPREAVARKLAALGLEVNADWILTAPAAAREILLARQTRRCHLLVRGELLVDFEGIEHVDTAPEAVVVGDMGREMNHDCLNRAFRFLLEKKCAFLTLAMNRFFRTADGLDLDVKAYVAALEYATGRKAELIGKPARAFFEAGARSLGIEPGAIAVVGDDLESDVLGAQAAGMRGVLVRTGKFRPEGLERAAGQPDEIWESVGELPERLGGLE